MSSYHNNQTTIATAAPRWGTEVGFAPKSGFISLDPLSFEFRDFHSSKLVSVPRLRELSVPDYLSHVQKYKTVSNMSWKLSIYINFFKRKTQFQSYKFKNKLVSIWISLINYWFGLISLMAQPSWVIQYQSYLCWRTVMVLFKL